MPALYETIIAYIVPKRAIQPRLIVTLPEG